MLYLNFIINKEKTIQMLSEFISLKILKVNIANEQDTTMNFIEALRSL